MKFILSLRYFFFATLLVTLIASCSQGTTTKHSGRYSSASKRQNVKHRNSVEEKKYSYNTKKTVGSLGVKKESATRDEIVLDALKYTGRTYKYGGKSPETGFDCSGFTSFVFNQHGIPVSGPSHQQATQGKQKKQTNLLPGDLVFFGEEDKISHVAIVASNNKNELEVVHSTTSAGVKIDNISQSEYWQSKFLFGIDVISK